MADTSIWSFIFNAGIVVKIVLMILLTASVFSWTFIFQRVILFKQTRKAAKYFEQRFWSGIDLHQLFSELVSQNSNLIGLASIFYAGFNEFLRLCKQPSISKDAILEGVQRAMRVAETRELEILEKQIPFLATVGSTSPYVGLFGTVWGIMTSFQSLGGSAQQATIAMVAPGISEALIATAIGLFAAIPAVIAYNRFSTELERLSTQYEAFQEEFINILHRQPIHIVTNKNNERRMQQAEFTHVSTEAE